ncbi:MAG: alpha/beta hydrolase [Candidatus Aminicenantales bacterium]
MNAKKITGIIGIALVAATLGSTASPARLSAQSCPAGRTREGLRMKSVLLGRDVNYAVYLPPDYPASERRYPVVYLLHGYTDNESAWIQWGEVQQAADQAIAERRIPPMIIVMPDGGVTWYVNDAAGKVPYEDMFFREFIPHIDATFRTRADRENRGIAGLSMGGWGTLTYVLRHPEVFEACAAFSAAIWTEADMAAMPADRYDETFAPLFGPRPAGNAEPSEIFTKLNPLSLAGTLPEDSLKKVRYYLDCGDDDFLIEANMALHAVLLKRKIPHEFRVRDGAHNWSYWRTGITDGLAFIGQSFRR